jgi:hypothetical protein
MKHSGNDMIQITPNFRTNAAGLEFMAKLKARQPYPDHCCEWAMVYADTEVPCPYGKLKACMIKTCRDKQVWLRFSPFRSELDPIGQMSLFAPAVTHRRVWVHVTTGQRIDQATRPFIDVHPACKVYCAKLILLHERVTPSEPGTQWRVAPVHKRGAAAWLQKQQDKYAGQIKSCVFDFI